ncbi:MAG: dienelactone hydrolase family protein [Gammaproteobacteria bacterium]|nr:dienelactone hydrolase family protein [Gammaproteobacteria bacterium]
MCAQYILDGSTDRQYVVALAHGAGIGMDAAFMETIAQRLSEQDPAIAVARFEFPYMAQRRIDGKKRPPDREPTLRQSWLDVIAALTSEWDKSAIVIGGKSMGGRIASLVADEAEVRGLVCLGYPFHPIGKPEKPRTEHLRTLRTPTLICQGERDPMGTCADVAQYDLAPSIEMLWLPDGNHDLKPRKASGYTHDAHLQRTIDAIARHVHALPP